MEVSMGPTSWLRRSLKAGSAQPALLRLEPKDPKRARKVRTSIKRVW